MGKQLFVHSTSRTRPSRRPWVHLALALPLAASGTGIALGQDLAIVGRVHVPQAVHIDQADLIEHVDNGEPEEAFEEAFEIGDTLFETHLNALDGVGANVGRGERFTSVPRADLTGAGEWANHTPSRATGPNADSCNSCHRLPGDDGAGLVSDNVHRDPQHRGTPRSFIQRNTPHTFGAGGLQRLAEEMTEQLSRQRNDAVNRACRSGAAVTAPLSAKGVSYGTITVRPSRTFPCPNPQIDTSRVAGISSDLVVRPFQWKGSVAFIRDFNRGAAHNEIGMQGVELVGNNVDGDFDGVKNELTVGDLTSLAVYIAAQPRPTTKLELARLGVIPALSATSVDSINRGQQAFHGAACDSCHVPALNIDKPTFQEPSANAAFRDATFPSGVKPISAGVDPTRAIRFDLTRDQPDNRITAPDGSVVPLGSLRRDPRGAAIVELFGDLKRHDMGPGLAESIDETGSGASVFLTENLWGVGTTAPYLHDGRATTLTEAITAHGGEAAASRNAFVALPDQAKKDLVAFLDNLVLYKAP